MLVENPTNSNDKVVRPLGDIKAGKTVEIESFEGDSTALYMVLRTTPLERINAPFEKVLLCNLATGRVLYKSKGLKVAECSTKAQSQYWR